MTVGRARLSWRSPPRLSRCRIVWPLDAGSGATPASRAKQASEWTRSRRDQVTISWAATIGPTPGSFRSSGTSDPTCLRDLVLELVGLPGHGFDPPGQRAQRQDDRVLIDRTRVGAAEAAAATHCPSGSRRSSSRSCSGAVTITLRSWTSATRRTSTALRRAKSSTHNAS